jgi:hypothetical protein
MLEPDVRGAITRNQDGSALILKNPENLLALVQK